MITWKFHQKPNPFYIEEYIFSFVKRQVMSNVDSSTVIFFRGCKGETHTHHTHTHTQYKIDIMMFMYFEEFFSLKSPQQANKRVAVICCIFALLNFYCKT